MKELKIRKARSRDTTPWKLLLNADGPRAEVEKYLDRGELWLAELKGKIVGEMVLMETRADVW